MLDMGFAKPIERLVATLPKDRHTLLFSATMPKAIAALAESLLTDPASVEIAPPSTTVDRIAQSVMFLDAANKKTALLELLRDPRHRSGGRLHAPEEHRQRGLRVHHRSGDHRRGASRQQVAGPARARARCVPRGYGAGAGRNRHRRARDRRRHGDARVQPRSAEPARKLRPPHRPHRSRRAQRLRDHAVRRRAARLAPRRRTRDRPDADRPRRSRMALRSRAPFRPSARQCLAAARSSRSSPRRHRANAKVWTEEEKLAARMAARAA